MPERNILNTADIKVIGLGQACLDHLGTLSDYPPEDGKCELIDLHIQCGGPASTALVALSRLGIKTSFLGSISDDPFGLAIIKGLREEKVDAAFLKVAPGCTSHFAFIGITENTGNRTVFWHRGSAPQLKAGDIDLSAFTGAEILHVDGLMVEAAQEAARQARTRGMKVVMDAGTMREGSLGLVGLVDVLIASEKFVETLVGKGVPLERTLDVLHQLGPREVIITHGSKGSIGLRDKEIIVQDAFLVKAKDTTGAGDVYHGAYIYGLLQTWEMSERMRFASAAAALKCREIGARQGIPNLNQIRELMGESTKGL